MSSWLTGSVTEVTPQGFQPPVQRVAEPLPVSHVAPLAKLPASVIRHGIDPPRPAVVISPPPEPPGEAEARRVLAETQQTERDANAAVEAAQAAYARATQHLADCIDEVAGFDDLDAEITAFTAAALRSGEGRPRIDEDEELRGKIVSRDRAHAALATARAAEGTLAEELSAARGAAKDAAAAHGHAVRDVVLCEADKVAERYRELQREADSLAATATGARAALADAHGTIQGFYVTPGALKAAMAHAGKRTSAVAQWRRVAEALRADAAAVVTIDPEPMPDPPPPSPYASYGAR